MSGESKTSDANDWRWGHVMWQRRGIRLEEWADMPRSIQLAYIASEELALNAPLNAQDRLAKVYIKSKK